MKSDRFKDALDVNVRHTKKAWQMMTAPYTYMVKMQPLLQLRRYFVRKQQPALKTPEASASSSVDHAHEE